MKKDMVKLGRQPGNSSFSKMMTESDSSRSFLLSAGKWMGVLFLKCHQMLFFRKSHRAILFTVKHDIYNGVLAADFTGGNLTSRRILMLGSSEKRVFMGMSSCDV
ncbi:hypothetical protein [Pantoea sp.]|uniref:hypothetical protein n=1 Tax=Pantoea sp. TaxID=69393 RepID=UPI0028A675E1|nr:hypothetical protein [Pantoea sp.]